VKVQTGYGNQHLLKKDLKAVIITDKNIDGGKAFAWEEFDILHYAAMVELKKKN